MAAPTAAQVEELRRLCGPEADAQLRAGGESGLDDASLRRWLVARKGDVKAAAKDLKAHAAWRAQYVPRGRISEEEVIEDLEQNKAFLPGYCKEGRPLCLVVVSRHQIKDAEMSKRCIAYSLDCAALMGSKTPGWDGKMSGIFDLRDLKASNCDFSTLRNVFDLLQNHYPERLHKLWLFAAPVIFYGLWKMVYPFIDPVTREKVKFVYEKDAMTEFTAAFDLDVLPPELVAGGRGRWVRVDERYRMLLAEADAAAAGGGGGGARGPCLLAGAPACGGSGASGSAAAASAADGAGEGEGERRQLQDEAAATAAAARPIEVTA